MKSTKIAFCKKRNGAVVPFDKNRIENAIYKAFLESGEGNQLLASKTTKRIIQILIRSGITVPEVEQIQDIVERVLIEYNFQRTAKKYILYRDTHARLRAQQVAL